MNHQLTIELAKQAMIECDVELPIGLFRGGTDGARFSFMGATVSEYLYWWHNATVFMS
ncbi:hypothetical protein O9992_20170 [Vibrio lentus]|nr:hypothetical protein [Vibrio lentus]